MKHERINLCGISEAHLLPNVRFHLFNFSTFRGTAKIALIGAVEAQLYGSDETFNTV
jgi:hypothetical protein